MVVLEALASGRALLAFQERANESFVGLEDQFRRLKRDATAREAACAIAELCNRDQVSALRKSLPPEWSAEAACNALLEVYDDLLRAS